MEKRKGRSLDVIIQLFLKVIKAHDLISEIYVKLLKVDSVVLENESNSGILEKIEQF